MMGELTCNRLTTVFDGHSACWIMSVGAGTCLKQQQTFDPASSSTAFVLIFKMSETLFV